MNNPIEVLCENGFELIDYSDTETDTGKTIYHLRAENGREFRIMYQVI